MGHDVEVFLIEIGPPLQEQDRTFGAAFGLWPVNPADRMAVPGMPQGLARGGGDFPAVACLSLLANSSLLRVVTF